MLMPNSDYSQLSNKVINDVVLIVDNHLKDDWVIRIEYADEVEYLTTNWRQWGQSFYKVIDSTEVVDNIYACHIKNQFCSIRLHAEKFKPESNFYYTICNECHVTRKLRDASLESE